MSRLAQVLRCTLALAVACVAIARSVRAQPAAYHAYTTMETAHFHVHAGPGLEREARVAAASAERAYALLSKELVPPRGTIDLVVSDDADYSNGFATPYPSNRIVVFATPPIEHESLRLNEDWLQLVVTHELTHIFHLDRARGIWGFAQKVFGRAPGLFPNQYQPAWLIEGLAVYYESRLTSGGRLKDAEHRDIARAAALDDALPGLGSLSLSSPRFPGGSSVYAYGSLFVDYLARTRGDSTVGKFVEETSGQLLPFLIDRGATHGFGVSFSEAYREWGDSVRKSVHGVAKAPLPGWRELTHHGYYVSGPRWLGDSALLYSASDGRSSLAAYRVDTLGHRTGISRRNGLVENVPLADGGMLYAQPDYSARSEVRSDLYVEKDGVVKRLTHGARLIQPDARGDGRIVAVRVASNRSDLVRLSPEGDIERVVRLAQPGETWSEPRWSPAGNRIVAVHLPRGGPRTIEIVEASSNDSVAVSRVIATSDALLGAPSWSPDGQWVLYVSEANGLPQVMRAPARGAEGQRTLSEAPSGLDSPVLSASGQRIAAVQTRGDGYHIGIAPVPRDVDAHAGLTDTARRIAASPSAQPIALGPFTTYDAWQSLRPRYWLPLIESSPDGGTRFGAGTSGTDVLGRHAYVAWAAIANSGRYPVGSLFYRYAGLQQPLFDVVLSQDWNDDGGIGNQAGQRIGTLLRRRQDASLAATFVMPRYRQFSSWSIGTGVERRTFATSPDSFLVQLDSGFSRSYLYPRAFVGASWSNAQRPSLSISPEDGFAMSGVVRERLRADDASRTASASAIGVASAYKSLDLPGFAHHVLAARAAVGVADRKAASALEVGGTSGGTLQLVSVLSVGEGRRTFGVRGFPPAFTYGTSAMTGSVEYRAPLSIAGGGIGALPIFFDRASLTAFADAGRATCASNPLYPGTCAPAGIIGNTIASVGGEVALGVALLQWDSPDLFRLGVALPVQGRNLTSLDATRPWPTVKSASAYVSLGLSY